MIIVSACLAGIKCNYNNDSKPCQEVVDLVKAGKAIPLCPEQLGGLPTPRPAAELSEEKVITNTEEDVTKEFLKGAEEVLKIAQMVGAKEAILKSKSPSCGCGKVYDGTFSKTLIDDDGVTVKLLKKNGIKVRNEK
jgi:uncharacterized protein YbbK (DUF523 family)